MIIDSHAHLNSAEIFNSLDDVILRARAVGIGKIVSICVHFDEIECITEIARRFDDLVCYSVGVHPEYAAKTLQEYSLDELLTKLGSYPKCVAFGECGLDYYRGKEDSLDQKRVFEKHIEASCNYNKPLILHTRNAEQDTISILNAHKNLKKVVMHCYTGSLDLVKFALNRGFYISFSGIITFKKAEALREVVRYVPVDRMLIETDAPFLSPEPKRGQVCEPAYIKYTGDYLAQLKGIDNETFYDYVLKNFNALFFS